MGWGYELKRGGGAIPLCMGGWGYNNVLGGNTLCIWGEWVIIYR